MSGSFNFARRPFRNDRPIHGAAALLFLMGAVLLVINIRLYTGYRRSVADTRAEIASLEQRGRKADEKSSSARSALGSYKVSSLAEESRGLARIAAERRFSWTTLLGRLERTLPPDVGLGRLQPRFGVNGEVGIDMQFFARDKEAIVRTIAALSKDPAFEHVAVHTESQQEASPDTVEFTLFAEYDSTELRSDARGPR